jgi:hypothetical protein
MIQYSSSVSRFVFVFNTRGESPYSAGSSTMFHEVTLPSPDDAEWAEVEAMGPPNDQLLAFARKHRAPQQWYDEPSEPL